MAEQYDISPARRKVLEENAKRRLFLREEFMKKVTDPFRHGTGEGGAVFDPAIQRFVAMRFNSYEHFRPNVRNTVFSFGLVFMPILAFAYLLKWHRDTKEAAYRNGEVPYSARRFKFA